MTSPLASLGKTKRTPFHRPAPFRPKVDIESIINADLDKSTSATLDDELVPDDCSDLVEDVTSSMVQRKYVKIKSSRKLNAQMPEKHAPNDMDLMNNMMGRISQLQLRMQFHEKEIADKACQIKSLQHELKLAQMNQKPGSDQETVVLKKENDKLRKRLYNIEEFLTDYGMMWVGDSDSDSEEKQSLRMKSRQVWHPTQSLPEFNADYDLILENIRDLNILAGEGETRVHHTTGGAELKRPDPIKLSLYANGILLFNGPFRPFTDPSTQQCVQDLMDGYFPTELQNSYPDGVLFSVQDRRHSHYEMKSKAAFEGHGQTLGGEIKPSRLVPNNIDKRVVTTDDSHVQRVPTDKFLSQLPANVIKKGRVINIRQAVSDLIQGEEQLPGNVSFVNTTVVEDLRKSAKGRNADETDLVGNCATLRIKHGDLTYVLVMKYSETVGDIRRHLCVHSQKLSGLKYDLVTSYPRKVYTDEALTLEEAGLIPNALLHLHVKK